MLRAASLCLFVFVYAPLSISGANPPQQIAEAIAELPHLRASAPDRDWLVDSSGFKAGSYRTDDPREFALDNGLLRRIFRVSPNGATVAFDNLVSQQSMLRSLFSSRNVGSQNMIVSPQGQKPTHGQCPAVASEWGLRWMTKIRDFYERTGFDQFENDGPYPGDVDVTPRPPLQYGEQDSQWVQGRLIASLYQDLRAKGIYINAPDYYYLNGSNKCGMGYREVNWSLPRADQVIHTRQNIYDGGWSKTPSMGWMFVPLSEYHGGGAAATIEPLREHIDHYRRMLESNLGMGVQAHYRGPRLFDTEDTRRMVQDQVDWFKKYRDILESDFVHGRRADGRDLDWILHVNPGLEFKGMLCVYNPTEKPIDRHLRVSVKYTGLRQTACFRRRDEEEIRLPINDDGCVQLSVTVPANAMEWWLVR